MPAAWGTRSGPGGGAGRRGRRAGTPCWPCRGWGMISRILYNRMGQSLDYCSYLEENKTSFARKKYRQIHITTVKTTEITESCMRLNCHKTKRRAVSSSYIDPQWYE